MSLWAALTEGVDTNGWGTAANNVQIGIGLMGSGNQVKTNQQYNLSIRIRNLSTNESFDFYNPTAIEQGDPVFFQIATPSGKDASPAPAIAYKSSGMVVSVQPNQTYQYEVGLSWFYGFHELGTYKIVAKLKTGRKDNWVISNPLYLTVVPGKWEPANAP